jgi:hypothetical protein
MGSVSDEVDMEAEGESNLGGFGSLHFPLDPIDRFVA